MNDRQISELAGQLQRLAQAVSEHSQSQLRLMAELQALQVAHRIVLEIVAGADPQVKSTLQGALGEILANPERITQSRLADLGMEGIAERVLIELRNFHDASRRGEGGPGARSH